MKDRLLDILVCPIGKTPLELMEWESSPVQLSEEEKERTNLMGFDPAKISREIKTGLLLNRELKLFYPVENGIPRMLTFRTGLNRTFIKKHAERINSEFRGFQFPDEEATPGEENILRTFSSEWIGYDWNEEAYWNLPADELYKGMKFSLDLDNKDLDNKLVMEIGIGIGGTANYVAESKGCEIIGTDLGCAVDAAYRNFNKNNFMHIVQASLFAPPFREETYDFVYSHGVLLHTYSVKKALESVSKLPKFGGSLYVWICNPDLEMGSLYRGLKMLAEKIIRPFCTRLPDKLQSIFLSPIVPLYIIHQNILTKRKNTKSIKYGWREAMHAARDRFTPQFRYCHSYEELAEWFRQNGYGDLQFLIDRERPSYVAPYWVNSTGIEGTRVAN